MVDAGDTKRGSPGPWIRAPFLWSFDSARISSTDKIVFDPPVRTLFTVGLWCWSDRTFSRMTWFRCRIVSVPGRSTSSARGLPSPLVGRLSHRFRRLLSPLSLSLAAPFPLTSGYMAAGPHGSSSFASLLLQQISVLFLDTFLPLTPAQPLTSGCTMLSTWTRKTKGMARFCR